MGPHIQRQFRLGCQAFSRFWSLAGEIFRFLKFPPKIQRKIVNLLSQVQSSAQHGFVPSLSFSEQGEDLLISQLEHAGDGSGRFYVDVGAHHPYRYSITARLAAAGWDGACFDVTSSVPDEFQRARPEVFSLRQLVGSAGTVKFYRFDEELVSTTDHAALATLAAQGFGSPAVELLDKIPLHVALNRLGIEPRVINFCNIDVEGGDLDVLASHDFGLYPIEVLLVELLPVTHSGSVLELVDPRLFEPTVSVLAELGYSLSRFQHRSGLFVKTAQKS